MVAVVANVLAVAVVGMVEVALLLLLLLLLLLMLLLRSRSYVVWRLITPTHPLAVCVCVL